jgi:hypothetical protein
MIEIEDKNNIAVDQEEEVVGLEIFVVIILLTRGEVVEVEVDRLRVARDREEPKVIELYFDRIGKNENGSKNEGENEEIERLFLMYCPQKNRLHWKNCKRLLWHHMGLILMSFSNQKTESWNLPFLLLPLSQRVALLVVLLVLVPISLRILNKHVTRENFTLEIYQME